MSWTKEYRAEYMKKYREKNREQINANKRYWLKRHPERASEDSRKYYEKHKGDPKYKAQRNEAYKRWRDNHRDEWNAYQREYYRLKKLAERSEA